MEQPDGAPFLLRFLGPRLWPFLLLATLLPLASCDRPPTVRSLADFQRSGRLVYGCDKEGGGPYAYPDPNAPATVTGFEVELLDDIADRLGVRAEFSQGQWDTLLQNLATGRVDVVVNGYEWTPHRARDYLFTRPYYVYQLQLMAPVGRFASWEDLASSKPDGRRPRVGVLGGSAAETFTKEDGRVEVVSHTGATDAMLSVVNGQIDGTLQDVPAARFYRGHYPGLEAAGPPVGRATTSSISARETRP